MDGGDLLRLLTIILIDWFVRLLFQSSIAHLMFVRFLFTRGKFFNFYRVISRQTTLRNIS